MSKSKRIIITGAGSVGKYLAKLLSKEKHEIIVIDTDPERLSTIGNQYDLMTMEGSGTSFRTLEDAKIHNADLFIAVTHSEEINLLSAMLAKKMGAKKTIARVDNMEFVDSSHKNDIINMGIDKMIYPEKIAAKEIVDIVHQTETNEAFEFSGGKLRLFVLTLDKNTPLVGKTLKEASIITNSIDYRVVAICRNQKTIIPSGNDVLKEGDVVYIITSPEGINNLISYSGKEKKPLGNIIILGGSRIGKRVAMDLVKNCRVKLIEFDEKKAQSLAENLDKCLVIQGDGRDMDLLIEEDIQNTDAFIAVTGDSETNILTCALAKKFGVRKAIAEIENFDYFEIASKMGIASIVNKKLSAASNIYSFTMNAKVSSVKYLTGADAELLEFVVNEKSKITKRPLKKLSFPKEAIVGGYIREEHSYIAKGETEILPGDKVVVFCLPEALDRVESYFR